MAGALIVPLNVAALRVSYNDATKLTGTFKGGVAAFHNLGTGATTGDRLLVRLEDANNSANQPLQAGVHLHWELPDHFRRGVQEAEGGPLVFPTVPNRWLVTRYLRVADPTTGVFGSVSLTQWIVESDAISPVPFDRLRPAVTVPVPFSGAILQPWQFMGRAVELATWLKGSGQGIDYLGNHTGPDGERLRLTASGFVGPGFSAYYPDCCSVFGFWDNFTDQNGRDVHDAIAHNDPLRFEAAYQVAGWIDDPASDPLATLDADVKSAYAVRLQACLNQNVAMDQSPLQVASALVKQKCRWAIKASAVAADVDAQGGLVSLTVPSRALCAGLVQSVLWDSAPGPGYLFLANTDQPGTPVAEWTDTVKLAAGNSPIEALSVLLKADARNDGRDDDIHDNDEFLLDALQLGLLYGIEQKSNRIADLEEMLHARAFSRVSGGQVWTVRPKLPQGTTKPSPVDDDLTLPPALAQALSELNKAQKAYDQGRAALQTARRQLFMDWFRYIKIYTGEEIDSNVSINTLADFVSNETAIVSAQAAAVGRLEIDSSGSTTEATVLKAPVGGASLAQSVFQAFLAVETQLSAIPAAGLVSGPAAPFWLPAEPVLVMQGNRTNPVQRNGAGAQTTVRSLGDLIDRLVLSTGTTAGTVVGSTVPALPQFAAPLPMLGELAGLAMEAALTVPMLADAVVAAWAAQGGAGNPATSDAADILAALQAVQGGPGSGLFATVRATSAQAQPDPVQSVTAPVPLAITFSNAAAAAWPPDPVAWSAQTLLPEFGPHRRDPFLPVFLIWSASLDPLKRLSGDDYRADNVGALFTLGNHEIDLAYKMPSGIPMDFAAGKPLAYRGSNALSKRPAINLVDQIDRQIADHPDDSERASLETLRTLFASQKFIAQSLGGFGIAQTLRTPVPAIPVQDLVKGKRDAVTTALAAAIVNDSTGNWYDDGFNTEAPIATGPLAQQNFGPLRGGLLDIAQLEIVDVFGQRMHLHTQAAHIETLAAYPLRAQNGDTLNAARLVLPPRLLTPARLWFRWLSAQDDKADPDGFVEMNAHPASSPVCGWILPNHLDSALFFYGADGLPIGSYGKEHGDLVYRTCPGRASQTRPGRIGDDPARDIGTAAAPSVNPHLAALMWHIDTQPAGYLADLMASIVASDGAVHANRAGQDAGLAVLMGQPLAVARAVIALETQGGTLPLSQADTLPTDAFPADVAAGRVAYADRQKTSSAGLADVAFPIRLGDVANFDDGLVGYLLEPTLGSFGELVSPYAPAAGGNGVVQPVPGSLTVALNAPGHVVTMLLDPRAAVHAATGVLPVEELSIPPNQYSDALRTLGISFATHPVLRPAGGLTLPLPDEAGYAWSWIAMGAPECPIAAGPAATVAADAYSPQTIAELWLQLRPAPVPQVGS